MVPYVGWVLGPLALAVEWLTAMGDEKGMRIGDLLANTWVVLETPIVTEIEPKTDTQSEPSPEEPDVLDEGSTDI